MFISIVEKIKARHALIAHFKRSPPAVTTLADAPRPAQKALRPVRKLGAQASKANEQMGHLFRSNCRQWCGD